MAPLGHMPYFRKGLLPCNNCWLFETEYCEFKVWFRNTAAGRVDPNSCACAVQSCGKCKQVVYCSPACQKEHWKAKHKASCAQMQPQSLVRL